MADKVNLYAPDGREFVSSHPAEIVRLRASGYSDTPPAELHVDPGDGQPGLVFDPAEHTVDEVKAFLAEHPELADGVLSAEREGKNRSGITA